MLSFLNQYGLFLAKTLTLVIALMVTVVVLIASTARTRAKAKGELHITHLNYDYQKLKAQLYQQIATATEYKKYCKQQKQLKKQLAKQSHSDKKRLFMVQFNGDIKASALPQFRQEITAILSVATPQDEVVVCLESGGGMVHSYGLAASQLQRIKQHNIPLTVIIDKIAASGGYLMACVADKILAAPFAIIGSIGVVAQLPNFNRWLKKHGIDFEQLTAGEFKRTLTVFGENTSQGRAKMQHDLEDIHQLFKAYIATHRPQLDLTQVATGEHWLGSTALSLQLIDGLSTSDDYLWQASQSAELYQVSFHSKASLVDKLQLATAQLVNRLQQQFR